MSTSINISHNNNKINKFSYYIKIKQPLFLKDHFSIDSRRKLMESYTLDISNEKIKEILVGLGFPSNLVNKSSYHECFKMILANAQVQRNIFYGKRKDDASCGYEWVGYVRRNEYYNKFINKPSWLNGKVVTKLIDFLNEKELIIKDQFELTKKFKQYKAIPSLFLFRQGMFDIIDGLIEKGYDFKIIKDNSIVYPISTTGSTFELGEQNIKIYDLFGNYVGTQNRYFKINKETNKPEGRLWNSLFRLPYGQKLMLDLGDSNGNCHLDYGGMFISILSALNKVNIPSNIDPYLYYLNSISTPISTTQSTFSRQEIKRIFNICIYSDSKSKAYKAIRFLIKKKITNKEIDNLLNQYHGIPFFHAEENKVLFTYEGKITEYVIQKCQEENIPVFDTFDGFTVGIKNKQRVKDIMTEAFQKILKTQNVPGISEDTYTHNQQEVIADATEPLEGDQTLELEEATYEIERGEIKPPEPKEKYSAQQIYELKIIEELFKTISN